MDIFLLGAGKPAHGENPTALKSITLDQKVMDWQLHSFEKLTSANRIHYLGGYNVEEVIQQYPDVNFTVNPDWQDHGVLSTLLKAPFSGSPAIVSYSDTIFRQKTFEHIKAIKADVVFGVDSQWQKRFSKRSQSDINAAETLKVELDGKSILAEFTGLIKFSEKVVEYLNKDVDIDFGQGLLELIEHLTTKSFTSQAFDVCGQWAEFNSPHDVAKFILGTKAETLARLEPRVKNSIIGKQVSFTVRQWNVNKASILAEIKSTFNTTKLIIRSSSKGEDNWFSSNAGGYESLLNINSADEKDVLTSIETVIASYGEVENGADQVLVQKQLQTVKASGVVFTCGLETGSPYYRFNFDDKSNSTESVTAGTESELRTIIVNRFGTEHLQQVEPKMVKVLLAIEELEQLLGYDKLDIEFAIDHEDKVHIFQVRPITVNHGNYEIDPDTIKLSLLDAQKHFKRQQTPSSFVYGEKTLFANMSDWNPAEIIGTRPKPLSFSLYRELITNEIWGIQRAQYGYRNTQPCPLIHSFSGQPYVDVRASINSFIPASISSKAAERLANASLQLLADNPHFHDKIEFDVLFTIWTPQLKNLAAERLTPYGVTQEDIVELQNGLKQLTRNALTRLQADTASISQLSKRRANTLTNKLPIADKIHLLIEDCKQFGTLAFAHAARAGFVATTLLKSLVASADLSEERRLEFLNSFNTVAGDFEKDKFAHAQQKITDEELTEKYGHLRPGTYEITTQAYWEDFDCYLKTDNSNQHTHKTVFEFSAKEKQGLQNFLNGLNSSLSTEELQDYLIRAIQAREFVKFEFTKNLSAALDLCCHLGERLSISRHDMSFLHYHDILSLRLNIITTKQLREIIQTNKNNYTATHPIELPALIKEQADFYAFERMDSSPNFVTINRIEAEVQVLTSQGQSDLSGKLVLIEQADPGYDWLFGHGIAGLITQYGGANSHMAIRAAEINLPAAIGVGDKLYEKISIMKKVEMDCANQIIRELF